MSCKHLTHFHARVLGEGIQPLESSLPKVLLAPPRDLAHIGIVGLPTISTQTTFFADWIDIF